MARKRAKSVPSTGKPVAQATEPGASLADAEAKAKRLARPNNANNLPRDPLTGQVLNQPKNRKPQSLADAAQHAFSAVGGKRWLKRQAQQYPKEFMALMARVASDDPQALSGVGYVPLVVPVEQRELPSGELEPLPVTDALDPLM